MQRETSVADDASRPPDHWRWFTVAPRYSTKHIGALSFGVIALAYGLAAWLLAGTEGLVFEHLHIALDSSNAMLSGLFALFLWITAAFRKERGVLLYLGIAFALAAATELLHALIGIEWQGHWVWINATSQILRPATWPPSTYLLPLAMGLALWAEPKKIALFPFTGGLLLVTGVLYTVFFSLPSYQDIGFLGVHRPYQAPVLLLLGGLTYYYWRERAQEPIYAGLARCLAFLFVSDFFMLFSISPHEKWAMVAHSGKFFGYLLAHFAMIESSLADIGARNRAEEAIERQTSSLVTMNRSLADEIGQRKRSEDRLRTLRDALEIAVESRTEQFVLANQALAQQLAFSEHLVDAMPGIFYLVDDSGRLRRWNNRFEAVSGYRSDELDGKHALDFFAGTDQSLIAERITAVFRDGQSDAQAAFVTKDGRRIPYYFTGLRTILDERPCLIGLGVDISARQQAEEALAHASIRNELFLHTASDGIHIVDADGTLLEASNAFASMLGYERSELLGSKITRWEIDMPLGRMPDVLAGLIAGARGAVFETRYRRRDGGIIDVEISAKAIELDGRTILYCSGRDITERKCVEARKQIRHRLFELLAGDSSLSEILRLTTEYVEQTSSGLLCAILLLDDDGHHLKVTMAPNLPDDYNRAVDGLAVGEGVCCSGTAVYRGERVVAGDIGSDPHWDRLGALAVDAGLAACWSEPIRNSQGQVVGAFAIYRRRAGEPNGAEIELGREAATLAGIAIERKRIDEELQLAAAVYQASSEGIVVCDKSNLIVGINPAFTSLTGYGAEEVLGRDPKMLGSARTSRELRDAIRHSLLATGSWQGEIWNQRKNGEEYTEWLSINTIYDARGLVYRYIGMFSDITEKKRSEDTVWRQANYDTLTELPNRRLFGDRLQQELKKMQRDSRPLALMFIDLDFFKEVNDRLGHNVGDQLLVAAARRIAECVRKSDTVARLGGDEFTVILPDVGDCASVERIAQLIVRVLGEPFRLGGETARITASIGITLYPRDAADVESLLRSADQAMYAAKGEGRNGYRFFEVSRPKIPTDVAPNP